MIVEWGELAVRASAAAAVACYVGRLFVELRRGDANRRTRQARRLWTIGCLVFLVHVAAAFQFYHGWSHAAAYRHTAERTEAVIGWYWGGGLLVNYLFTAVWVIDTADWWLRPERRRGRRVGSWALQAFFAFMAVNATVVFGPPYWKWLAAAVAVGLIACVFRCR